MRLPAPRALRRRRSLLAAALLGAAVVAGPAQSAAACSGVARLADGWERIKPPSFASGGVAITSYDVVPGSPERLVVTNGVQVQVSGNGGCSWSPVQLPAAPALTGLPSQEGGGLADEAITSVRGDIIDSANVWAAGVATVLRGSAAVTRPRVLVSADGGRSFTDRTGGLPELGEPVAIRPGLRGWGYLLFHSTLPSESYALYATFDGGASWNPQVPSLPAGLADITLDLTTGDVYLFGSAGLYVVEPGASAARKVPGVPTDVTAVTAEMLRVDNKPGRVTAFVRKGQARYETTDRGRHVRIADAPSGVRSATAGYLPGLLALAAEQPNVRIEPPRIGGFSKRPAADFSPFDDIVGDLRFVRELNHGAGFRLYAVNAKALYRRVIPLTFLPPRQPPLPSRQVTVNGRTPARAAVTLAPREQVVSLLPGQRRTVDYRLTLPPLPTPLDVFFMTDSTGSMSTAITSVQENLQRIVDDLYDSGIDVQFGVADFRDYPEQSQVGQQNDNYPYKLRRKIGPVNSALANAIENLTVGGGTQDGDDSALEAIYQAVTGAGRPDPLLARGYLIPPGLGADFRDNALKVVFVASDDEMRHPGASAPTPGSGVPNAGNPGYPGPSLDTVAKALSAYGVHFVGLDVLTDPNASPRADMEALAIASNTLAPDSGIDCDADGSTTGADDVRAGQPIVCGFDPDSDLGIAPTFFALLDALRDYGPVDLQVSGPSGQVRPMAATHFPKVDLKAASDFRLPVEFSCDQAHAGTETAVQVRALTRGREVATTQATLRCLSPKSPAVEVPPLIAALVPVAVAPIAPPPPPANPVPNPNPNPQLNPNAGFATNEEQQAQLALAESDAGESESADEVAFSAVRPAPVSPSDLAWVGAVMLLSCAGFGVHLARRSRSQLAEQPAS